MWAVNEHKLSDSERRNKSVISQEDFPALYLAQRIAGLTNNENIRLLNHASGKQTPKSVSSASVSRARISSVRDGNKK